MLRVLTGPGAFRLILALTVVGSHVSRFDVGRVAVLLFFVLSGYWVTRIWVEEFDGRALLRFYEGRWLRVMPLYWLAVGLAAWLRAEPLSFTNLLLFGVASGDVDPTGVSWSLDIELQFYLLAPPLALLLLHRNRRIAAAAALLASLSAATAAWWFAADSTLVTVAQYLPAFLIGGAIYSCDWRPSARAAAESVAAFAAITAVLVLAPQTASFFDKTIDDPFDRDIFAAMWMLPLLPYVAWSLRQKAPPLDRHLGNFSFPLYLAHYPMIAWLAPSKPIGVAAGIALALAMYVAFDRNVERLRRAVLARRRLAAVAAA